MIEPSPQIDADVLAAALRDVAGEEAEHALVGGQPAVARLVRRLLANPTSARELMGAVTARAVERRLEAAPPTAFGPVATDGGTYDDPPLMLDPIGSPEFERAIDSMIQPDGQRKDG